MDPAADPPARRDLNEDFLRLFVRYEPELRAFVTACLPCRADVDEVLQSVSLVAWRKFSLLEEPAQFPRWACLIAHYEILKFRRTKARDRLVLDEDIIERLGEEGAAELPYRQRQLTALDDCIGRLSTERRELVMAAYAPDSSMKMLAGRLSRTEGSLYQLIARIRQELLRCVERTLSRETL